MKNVKRFLALLLAVLMVSGNIVSAVAVDMEPNGAEVAEDLAVEAAAEAVKADDSASDTLYNNEEEPAEDEQVSEAVDETAAADDAVEAEEPADGEEAASDFDSQEVIAVEAGAAEVAESEGEDEFVGTLVSMNEYTYGQEPSKVVCADGWTITDVKYVAAGDEETTSEDAPDQAGEYVAIVTVEKDGESKVESLIFNVLPAVITVTAQDWSIVYGDDDPDLTKEVDVKGIVAGDEVDVPYTVSLEPYEEYDYSNLTENGEPTAVKRPVKEDGYYIYVTAGGEELNNPNYTVQYVDGTLTVNPKDIADLSFQTEYDYTLQEPIVSVDTLTNGVDYNYTFKVAEDDASIITVSITGIGNYTGSRNLYCMVTMTSLAGYTVTMTDIPEGGYVYNGEAHNPTVVVTDAEGNLLDASCYTVSYFATVSAGTGYVYVDGVEDLGYAGRATANFTIAPRPITVVIDEKTVEYGKAAEDLTYTITEGELVDGDSLHCVLTTDYKAGDPVGSYDITVSLLADVLDEEGNVVVNYDPNFNYEITLGTGEDKLTVVPAGREGFSVENYNGVYDGEPHFLTFTGLEEGKDEITYSVNGVEWIADAPSITNAGVLNVQVRVQNGDYAEMTGEGAIYDTTLEVTPAELTVTTEGAEKVYDGKPLTPGTTTVTLGDTTVSFTGNSGAEIALIGDDIGTINITGAQTEVGSVETICSLEVANGSKDNYTINYTSGTLTVKDYAVVTVANAEELETEIIYDGEEHAWVPELMADGEILPASAYVVDYSRLNLINAGEITVTITLNPGYTFTAGARELAARTAEYKYTIQKRVLPFAPVLKDGVTGHTISGDAENGYVISREYDEEALPVEAYLDAEIIGLNAGESAPYIVIFDTTDDGSIEYTVNGRPGYALRNYEIPEIKISLVSAPRDIGRENSGVTAALEDETAVYTYNGKAYEPEVVVTYNSKTLVEGTDYTVSYAGNVNAGTGYAIITGQGNFTGELRVPFEIAKAALAIRPDTAQFVYNGEVQVPGGKIVYGGEEIEFAYAAPIRVTLESGDTVILTRPENFTTPVGTGVGYSNRYNCTITDRDDNDASGNYVIDNDISVKFSIVKAELTGVTVEMANTEYGTALAPSISGTDLRATYHYMTADGEPIAEGMPRNAGDYKVYAAWEGTADYAAGQTDAVEFKITPKPVTVKAAAQSKTYGEDDPALTYTVDGLAYNDNASVISASTERAEGENVGTYAITVTGEEEQGNYAVIYENDGEAVLRIEPKSIRVRPETVKLAYGDPVPAQWNLTFEVLDGEALVGDDTLRYDGVATTYTSESEPGSYKLTVSADAALNPNYNVTWEEGAISVNDRRELEIGGQGTHTYDGQSHNFLVSGLMPGDTVTYNLLGQESRTVTIVEGDGNVLTIPGISDVGSVTLEKIVISNPEYRDYVSENLTMTIMPRDFTVSQPENVVYNGQSQRQPVTVTSGLPMTAEDYEVAYSEETTNAGTVTVTVTGKGNYEGYIHEATYAITPALLTVTTASASKAYDGAALTAAGSIEGFVNGESASFTATGSQTDVGFDFNSYSILWDGTAQEGNYTVEENLGTLTVERRDVNTLALSAAPVYTYDGTAHQWSPVVSIAGGMTLAEGADYYVTYSTDDPQSAGSITVTINGIGNFEGYISETYTIRRAPLTVTTASAAKTYDGTALTAGGSISGLAAGDTVTFSVTGHQTDVGSSLNTYSLVWNRTAVPTNYDIANITENLGTLTVNPAPALIEEGNPTDGEGPADAEEPADDEGLTSIEEDETPLAEAPAGDYSLTEDGTITTLEEDETPLAGSPLEDADCILHFLLLVAALAVAAYYGYTRKKHRELEKKLQDEIAKV